MASYFKFLKCRRICDDFSPRHHSLGFSSSAAGGFRSNTGVPLKLSWEETERLLLLVSWELLLLSNFTPFVLIFISPMFIEQAYSASSLIFYLAFHDFTFSFSLALLQYLTQTMTKQMKRQQPPTIEKPTRRAVGDVFVLFLLFIPRRDAVPALAEDLPILLLPPLPPPLPPFSKRCRRKPSSSSSPSSSLWSYSSNPLL